MPLAYLFFIGVRMFNPDLWQPWFGGEKQMEFAFLNGILRSPTFPPVDPHFAGGVINYYYFGLYLVAYLIKLTGIYAEVAFNLTIATLFALTVVNSFAVAYSAARPKDTSRRYPTLQEVGVPPGGGSRPGVGTSWKAGVWGALLAPLFVTLIGNLDGFGQVVKNLANVAPGPFQSSIPGVKALVDAGTGLQQVLAHTATLPPYDFWGPSRVIPPTINEFPYLELLVCRPAPAPDRDPAGRAVPGGGAGADRRRRDGLAGAVEVRGGAAADICALAWARWPR